MKDYSDIPLSTLSREAMEERRRLLQPHVAVTPSVELQSPLLAPILGDGRVFLKLESLQKTGTFKARGALSVALDIPKSDLTRGITAASAGNHAIAAAWAAAHVGAPAKVVMMSSANPFRVARARMLGAEVVIAEGGAGAMAEAERLASEEGYTYIHPFEGPLTTLGAAGVGLEFLEQVADLDAVVVAIGGGGLISGVAAAVKAVNPACKVYGVEPEGACSMRQSLDAGRPVKPASVKSLADSLAAPSAMPFSFRVCQANIDDVVTLSDDDICAGVVLAQEEAKQAVEPAAGAAVAAVFGPLRARLRGKRVGVLICGANIDAESYGAILARGRDQVASLLG